MRLKMLLEDKELIKRYQFGDELALKELVRRHKSKIFTTIYLIVRNKQESEDLFQETFIKAINEIKTGKYREEGKFLPWVCRIAHNLSIDSVRTKKNNPCSNADASDYVTSKLCSGEENKEEHWVNDDKEKLVHKLIDELPEEQKDIVLLRHFSDMTFREIAVLRNISINTALGRMRYALMNLKKLILKHKYAYELYY